MRSPMSQTEAEAEAQPQTNIAAFSEPGFAAVQAKMTSVIASQRARLHGFTTAATPADLSTIDVTDKSQSRRSRKKEKIVFPRTPKGKTKAKEASSSTTGFGAALNSCPLTQIKLDAQKSLSVPLILHLLCIRKDYISKSFQISLVQDFVQYGKLREEGASSPEGLFRMAGSAVRQKKLREQLDQELANQNCRIGEVESRIKHLLSDANSVDVAAVLKQWLRGLPDAIISAEVQEKLVQDHAGLRDEADRALNCCRLTMLLLPSLNLSVVVYLLRFLSEFAGHSQSHKMDASNLAIVLTPTFFTVAQEDALNVAAGRLTAAANREAVIAKQTRVLELLIKNAEEIGYLPDCILDDYYQLLSQSDLFMSHSEDNLDDDDCAGGPAGPSERRTKKKKRRSGSISRVFSATMSTVKGLHSKVMSRANTPVVPLRSRKPLQPSEFTFENSVHRTPLPVINARNKPHSRQLTSPRLPLKRKVSVEHEMSPNSKQQRSLAGPSMSSLDSNFTPKVRSRSFSVKSKFRRKKSLKGTELDNTCGMTTSSSQVELSHISPLPNKPGLSLTAATPGTPSSLDFPHQGYDMDSPAPPATRAKRSQSLSPSPCRRNSRAANSTGESYNRSRKSNRSPSTRKIGEQRRRSRDSSNKKTTSLLRKQSSSASSRKSSRNSVVTHIFSSSEEPEPSSKDVKSSKHNESLVSLRQDLNSFIEKSFGGKNRDMDTVSDSLTKRIEAISVDDVDGSEVFVKPEAGSLKDSKMRRQSSAFEFIRSAHTLRSLGPQIRRQSSAFELKAESQQPNEEHFSRGSSVATRASLRRKNSSVKDLIKRLESGPKTEAAAAPEPKLNNGDSASEEWMDAAEFFNTPAPSVPKHLDLETLQHTSSGYKRSSIIKIRQENKGLVSKSVETFTRPQTPVPHHRIPHNVRKPVSSNRPALPRPPMSTNRRITSAAAAAASPVLATGNGRRHSARLGVASLAPVPASPLNRTGIRTTTSYKRPTSTAAQRSVCSASAQATSENNAVNKQQKQFVSHTETIHSVRNNPASKKKTPKSCKDSSSSGMLARGKRTEGRRHLTVIGYEGEVRSPLRERQNIVVTVQRSKSAQTPQMKKPQLKKPAISCSEETDMQDFFIENRHHLHPMVTRSLSMKQPQLHSPAGANPHRQSKSAERGKRLRRQESKRSSTT